MKLAHEVRPGLLQPLAPSASSGARALALVSIAAIALWNVAAPARADEPNTSTVAAPAKSAPVENDAAPNAADTRVWQVPVPNLDPRAAAATQKRPTTDPRGALGWEIVGGVVPAVSGITLILMSLRPGNSGGHVPSLRLNTPMLLVGGLLTLFGPAAGVSIAGNATGGRGSVGYTFLGSAAGLPLSMPGMVGGAVIGYRLSAEDAAPPACAGNVTLQVDGTW